MKKQFFASTLLAVLIGTSGLTLAVEEKHDHVATPATSVTATIPAMGTVKGVDTAKGKVLIDHDPITALNWPRMVMDFPLADKAMIGQIKVGDHVKFELTEGTKGAYRITKIEPMPAR